MALIDLRRGQPIGLPPAGASAAARRALEGGCARYDHPLGQPDLRAVVAQTLTEQLGVPYRWDRHIAITSGVSGALVATIQALTQPGAHIACPDPGWPGARRAVTASGRLPVACDPVSLEPMDGRSRPIAMVMLSSPANPTGHLLATSTMDMLSEMVADDPSLVIVSDETYRDLVYDGHEPRSPASRAALTQHTVVLRSFSKSHAMAGWRVGYLAAMEPLADRIMPLLTAAHATASTMAQQGARWILERGDASTQQLCHRYQERRNTLLRGLSRTPGLTVEPSQGGLYLFPRVPGSGDACARALWEQAEVAVYPGSRFGEAALRHIRLCFAHDQQVLEEAIARIVPVLSRWGAA